MDRHPYRSAGLRAKVATEADVLDSFEDRVVLALIAIVGLLGIGIGLLSPERTLEPSLGILMVFFAARAFFRNERSRSRS